MFVDSASRQCAVAHLMFESGAGDAASIVKRDANFARIKSMDFAELDAWAARSGFSKKELARIQPGYLPTPEQLRSFWLVVSTIGLTGALAISSIVINLCRLFFAQRSLAIVGVFGILLGIALVCLVSFGPSYPPVPTLTREIGLANFLAFATGVASIVCGILALTLRRGRPRIDADSAQVDAKPTTQVMAAKNTREL